MTQIQQLGFLANVVAVNTTSNTITFTSNSNIATAFNVGGYGNTTTGGFVANSSILAIGNSSINVVINSSSVYVSGVALGSGGGGGFSNGQSIMVSNTAYSNTANVSVVYTFYNTTTRTLDTVFI
jgi:hypothetical protein